MTTYYMFSDTERQEMAIETIYATMDEFYHRENRHSVIIDAGAILRWLALVVVLLASLNLVFVGYLLVSWL